MIGQRLGKWVILRELGFGGMGRVYLGEDSSNGNQAAIKVLAAELAQSPGFLHRFQREIETLSQLEHPHIVRLYESGVENGHYYYAMEYVDGASLEDQLEREQRLPWKDVLDIALQVCPALKHVHDHGIIHRDLKPANLLRTAGGVVKITDFGIAKVFAHGHLTATGGVIGTAHYLSPEQAAGKPVTKRSDLYSFGAVLYALLVGRPPFIGESVLDLLHKHGYAQFDPPGKILTDLPHELDEVVCQLLEKDPAKRPPDCHVLGRQLDSVRRKLERKANPTLNLSAQSATMGEATLAMPAGDVAGPATLMSRWVRQELNRQNGGGAFSQLFNRWYVVLPAFLLVFGFLVWALWPASAESVFQRGAELMKSKNPADWDRAWSEYLEPLQRDHRVGTHQVEIDAFRKQIETHRHEVEMNLAIGEGQRLYRLGETLRQDGKYQEARQVWSNLVTVFKHVDAEKEWVAKADNAVVELDKLLNNKLRLDPVWAAFKEGMALRDQGKQAEAEAIWRGIEELYRDDPAAADLIKEIKVARGK